MAAKIASTARIPATRTTLSCEPNSRIAKFFRAGGVLSIDTWPTATTGEPSGDVIPGTTWRPPPAPGAARGPAPTPKLADPHRDSGGQQSGDHPPAGSPPVGIGSHSCYSAPRAGWIGRWPVHPG